MRLAAVKPTTDTQTALSFYAVKMKMVHFIFPESEMAKETYCHILFLPHNFFARWKDVYANVNKDVIIAVFTQKIAHGIELENSKGCC